MFDSEKPYCKNCYHGLHGSTSIDACAQPMRSYEIYPTGKNANSVACHCKTYLKWSRADSRREEDTKIEEVESRLAKEHGIEGHIKRSKLWSLAWDYGHSSGFSEIENYYREFAELLT